MKALVLGGTGFVGRHLVTSLANDDKYSYVRSVDKVLPETAYLSKQHEEVYKNPKVEFIQGNLISEASISKMYEVEGGFDIVFNCAAETKLSQEQMMYDQKTYRLVELCAKEAVKRKVKQFIHLSNSQIYESGKSVSKETSKVDPWTNLAKSQLKADEFIVGLKNELNYTIFRPAVIYGPGDTTGIAPRVICASVYKFQKKKMEFLWSGDMKFNTVHVSDVVAAMKFAVGNEKCYKEIFNLVDKNDTTQKKICKVLEEVFGIQTGFKGSIVSFAATKVGFDDICDAVNNEHMKPWSEMCKAQGITNTPLSPYLDQELLYNNPLSISGAKFDATGFTYSVPNLTADGIREIISYFTDLGLFPKQN